MRFSAAFGGLILLASVSDLFGAQQSRDRLPGYQGISFGTRYEKVKEILGSGIVEDNIRREDYLSSGLRIKQIRLIKRVNGLDTQTYYNFDQEDKISYIAVFSSLSSIPDHPIDRISCAKSLEPLVSRAILDLGAPDSDETVSDSKSKLAPVFDRRTMLFKFKDGNEVLLTSGFYERNSLTPSRNAACELSIKYYTPDGRNNH